VVTGTARHTLGVTGTGLVGSTPSWSISPVVCQKEPDGCCDPTLAEGTAVKAERIRTPNRSSGLLLASFPSGKHRKGIGPAVLSFLTSDPQPGVGLQRTPASASARPGGLVLFAGTPCCARLLPARLN
jgi:hypothetical protein